MLARSLTLFEQSSGHSAQEAEVMCRGMVVVVSSEVASLGVKTLGVAIAFAATPGYTTSIVATIAEFMM